MSELDALIDRLVRPIEDWPEPGVTFRDITPLLDDPAALSAVIDGLVELAEKVGPSTPSWASRRAASCSAR